MSGESTTPQRVEPPTVNPFKDDQLRQVLIDAIEAALVPWRRTPEEIAAARRIALRMILGDGYASPLDDEVVSRMFGSIREMNNSLAKLTAIGHSAKSFHQMKTSGITHYVWHCIPQICEFKHSQLDGRKFPIDKGYRGALPGSKYGCCCTASAVIPGL